MTRHPTRLALASLLCSVISAHAADQPGFYLSADAGRSQFRLQDEDLIALIPGQTSGINATIRSTDKKDSTYALHAGYRLNATWALEAGYADLGQAAFTGLRAVNCKPGDACVTVIFPVTSASFSAKAWDAAVVGNYALAESWSVYGKAGASAVRIKSNISPPTSTSSKTSIVPLLAAGLGYQLTPSTSVHLEWNRHFEGSGDNRNGKSNIDAYTLGISYRF
jgi:opacity protein-like surface antigen